MWSELKRISFSLQHEFLTFDMRIAKNKQSYKTLMKKVMWNGAGQNVCATWSNFSLLHSSGRSVWQPRLNFTIHPSNRFLKLKEQKMSRLFLDCLLQVIPCSWMSIGIIWGCDLGRRWQVVFKLWNTSTTLLIDRPVTPERRVWKEQSEHHHVLPAKEMTRP